jgi:hypothetical protein
MSNPRTFLAYAPRGAGLMNGELMSRWACPCGRPTSIAACSRLDEGDVVSTYWSKEFDRGVLEYLMPRWPLDYGK